jgi:hypothetical protein
MSFLAFAQLSNKRLPPLHSTRVILYWSLSLSISNNNTKSKHQYYISNKRLSRLLYKDEATEAEDAEWDPDDDQDAPSHDEEEQHADNDDEEDAPTPDVAEATAENATADHDPGTDSHESEVKKGAETPKQRERGWAERTSLNEEGS